MRGISLLLSVFLYGTAGLSAAEFHQWAETPPMGWNSFDSFGAAVNEEEVRGNAKMMQVHLKEAGWQYVVVDYCWYYPYVGALNNPPQTEDFKPSLPMDAYGRLLPAVDRFPSAEKNGFKTLSDYVHSLGLKFGIHVMRGVPREAVARKLPIKGTGYTVDQIADKNSVCRWLNTMYGIDMEKPGAQEYLDSLFELYASWGVDYVKVDDLEGDQPRVYHAAEVEGYRKAIDHCGREMVFSVSPYIAYENAKDHVAGYANLWRISADFWDHWDRLKAQFELVHRWEKHIGGGSWPDADMIPFGLLNRRGPEEEMPRRSNFTDIEKYTLMTLWSICRSPLMYGGDLTHIRPIELKLLTNKEVIAVNQASENNRQLFRNGDQVAWVANVPGSRDKYLALFNLGEKEIGISTKLSDLGLSGAVKIRDLWLKTDDGKAEGELLRQIQPHGSALYRLSPDSVR